MPVPSEAELLSLSTGLGLDWRLPPLVMCMQGDSLPTPPQPAPAAAPIVAARADEQPAAWPCLSPLPSAHGSSPWGELVLAAPTQQPPPQPQLPAPSPPTHPAPAGWPPKLPHPVGGPAAFHAADPFLALVADELDDWLLA